MFADFMTLDEAATTLGVSDVASTGLQIHLHDFGAYVRRDDVRDYMVRVAYHHTRELRRENERLHNAVLRLKFENVVLTEIVENHQSSIEYLYAGG